MKAVKIGTTSWREAEALGPDEVEFTGEFLYEENGFTAAMVWDDKIGNVRPKGQADRDAEVAAAKEQAAREAKAKASRPYDQALMAAFAEVAGIDAATLEAKVLQKIDAGKG